MRFINKVKPDGQKNGNVSPERKSGFTASDWTDCESSFAS